ncbi:MAG TPA: DUF2177 family protein [Alphaproteobacteria bacterium]|jgi:uncharacterized membrane protein|nr:DUF2177 family protein [Alphaproteobacteria bacterium]
MARFACTYLVTAVVLLAIDSVWLWAMAGRLYRPQIGQLMRDSFDPVAAFLFYMLFVFGLVVFASTPSWDSTRWITPLWRGALFGLVAYGTYDLTNQATLRGWSWLVTGADLAWGTVLGAVATALGLTFSRAVLRFF